MDLSEWLNYVLIVPAATAFIYIGYISTKRFMQYLRDRKYHERYTEAYKKSGDRDFWILDTEIKAPGRIVEAYIKGDRVKLQDKETGLVLFEESIPEFNNVRERHRRMVEILGTLGEDAQSGK